MRFPRVKAEHRPFRTAGGTVRIGGEIYGLAAEIDDPGGWVWAALSLLDGRRGPEAVAARLIVMFPELSPDEARGVVDDLVGSGYLEEATAPPPRGLTPREVDRYSRNQAFFRGVDLVPGHSAWETQLALKRARVVVVGLGGTGSHAAWALAAIGVGRLHCVDPDLVELSNLNRQLLYTEADVGQPKADLARDRLGEANSDIVVTSARHRVTGEADLRSLVDGYDALALCADEPRGEGIRVWASRACAAARVPWAGGGYNGPLVTVGVFDPPKGACYECVAAAEQAHRPNGGIPDLGGPGVTGTSAGISGHLVAQAIISLVTGVPEVAPGYVHGINLLSPDHHVYARHPARAGCPTCFGP
ncbi:ThiF family adenylyltransferase [Herbidospora sp. NEAU-GS84]|uniref:ThiF family adenylyltransferase n=1 Tax=Herbidospora solisilvae TaxID=2696284 RepID=A0A7C9N1K2_9ACTN|nr:ThiF family adenylyltransferase [Herbidospora solisilvae]NAS21634.1 ThiF family adenylyltransferase [Herbidospora solisilvae]